MLVNSIYTCMPHAYLLYHALDLVVMHMHSRYSGWYGPMHAHACLLDHALELVAERAHPSDARCPWQRGHVKVSGVQRALKEAGAPRREGVGGLGGARGRQGAQTVVQRVVVGHVGAHHEVDDQLAAAGPLFPREAAGGEAVGGVGEGTQTPTAL